MFEVRNLKPLSPQVAMDPGDHVAAIALPPPLKVEGQRLLG